MFESIKKWFQRPIVININYEAVAHDTKLGVLTTPNPIDAKQARMIREAWSKYNKDFKVVVLSDGISLQALSDDDLKEIGLVRIESDDETATITNQTTDNQSQTKE